MGLRTSAYSDNIDNRPITPMRGTYKQYAEKFRPEDDSNYDDSNNAHNSPREREQIERSITTGRVKSGSPYRTMNSMSHTIDPRRVTQANEEKQSKPLSRTIGSATRKKTASSTLADEGMFNK